jgi:hypothetical protein
MVSGGLGRASGGVWLCSALSRQKEQWPREMAAQPTRVQSDQEHPSLLV